MGGKRNVRKRRYKEAGINDFVDEKRVSEKAE